MRIPDGRRRPRPGLSLGPAALIVVLGLGAGVAEPGRTIDFRVVAKEDGKPIAGAKVLFGVFRGRYILTRFEADAEGRCRIALPEVLPPTIYLHAAGEGRVPLETYFRYEEVVEGEADFCTLALPKGRSIGGVVKDEQGRPVAGAKLVCTYVAAGLPARASMSTRRSRPSPPTPKGDGTATSCPRVPPASTAAWSFRVEHPDFDLRYPKHVPLRPVRRRPGRQRGARHEKSARRLRDGERRGRQAHRRRRDHAKRPQFRRGPHEDHDRRARAIPSGSSEDQAARPARSCGHGSRLRPRRPR